MSEGIGYDIGDFIKSVEKNELSDDDFINLNTISRNKLKAFREEVIPACSTEELTKCTANLFAVHINRAFSEESGLLAKALEAPVLLQSQDNLLVNACMKEIGKRYLKLPDTPEKLSTVEIDPAILACYSNYKDKVIESILRMPEDDIRRMLSEDIVKIIEKQNPNAENVLGKLIAGDNALKSSIDSILANPQSGDEKDLIERVNEALSHYDVDANRKEIAEHIANRNIAYSISFVMYKNTLEMPSDVMSHESAAVLTKHVELAKPYGQYVMALRTQDLINQIPLKEPIVSSAKSNDYRQEDSELLKMAMQIDVSTSQNMQKENASVLKYVEEAIIEFIAKVRDLGAKTKIEFEKSLTSIYNTFVQIKGCFVSNNEASQKHLEDFAVHYTSAEQSVKIKYTNEAIKHDTKSSVKEMPLAYSTRYGKTEHISSSIANGNLVESREKAIAAIEEQMRTVIKMIPSEHRKELIRSHGTVMSELQTLHFKQERNQEKSQSSWQQRTARASESANKGVSR